jgi:thioredoxin reductase (NADPH)
MSEPVILVVDDDPQVLSAIRRDLKDRYQADYRILATASGESALETIGELKRRGDALAMIVSDQRMPGMLGVELLARCRDLYPDTRRVLLTAYSDIRAAIRGINEAHLDHYLEKPWDPPEERLYPAMDDLLSTWQSDYRAEVTGLRVVGHPWSARSHSVKEFLGGNLIPYRWLEAGRDEEAAQLMLASKLATSDLPAVVLENGDVLRNPEVPTIAQRLGLKNEAAHDLYDVIIVGAGPAGLAAAVSGAAEGLRTLLLDAHGPGGQAGASSRIENYLGFPTGVSGSELARRAITQAQRLGAEFLSPVGVKGISVDEGGYKRLSLDNGREMLARTVIAATGMTYREHPAEGMAERSGAGVYYGAAMTEGRSCSGRPVFVVGGGNSAGQAAVYLSRFASEVHIVIRRDDLMPTMSHYLIEQLGQISNFRLRKKMEIVRVEGDGRVERIWLRSPASDKPLVEDASAVFVFIGTRPHSDWLSESVLLDAKGFVLTGRDLAPHRDFSRLWKESRDPLPLETSIPGVFAAGDVRAGAMNRVASAVGEGSMAIRLVFDYLAHT